MLIFRYEKEGQTAVTFQCKYNNRYCFSCIFIADEDGKVLYISSLGDNSFTLKVHVKVILVLISLVSIRKHMLNYVNTLNLNIILIIRSFQGNL